MDSYSALQNPILSVGGNQNAYTPPATTRLTIEQMQNLQQLQNQNYQQQMPQENDPYTEGTIQLAQCSDLVKQKIVGDSRYRQIDNEFENTIKQFLYANIIPQLLSNQQGRIAAERWCNCIKSLKQEYSQEEVALTQNMQMLLSDEVVQQRLRELQGQPQPEAPDTSDDLKELQTKVKRRTRKPEVNEHVDGNE